MCRALIALIAIGLAMPVLAAEVPVETDNTGDWTSCRRDNECVVVGSICPNFYWAIHRDFVFANAARNSELRGTADCAASFQPRPQQATCQQGHCQIPLNQAMSGQSSAQ